MKSPEMLSRLMTGDRPWKVFLLRLSLGLFFFLAGQILQLKTPVEVEIIGGHLRWTVAGSSLNVPWLFMPISSLIMESTPGPEATGCGPLFISDGDGKRRLPAPGAFDYQGPRAHGDWWIDDLLPAEVVFSMPLELSSAFVLHTVFRGRFEQEMTLRFEALVPDKGFELDFRRGWINNDLLIRDLEGNILASTSIDPRPMDRLEAILATLSRAVAPAFWILALMALFAGHHRPEPGTGAPIPLRKIFILPALLLAAAASVQSLWIAKDIFQDLPHTPDEVIYRLQAHWILQGRLSGDSPPCKEHFAIPFSYHQDGRWIGHYPPAWPLLLSPGIALGNPALVPAILHGLFLFLVFLLGRKLGGDWVGLGAAFFALGSPLAALLFASTLSHAGSATLLLLALVAAIPSRKTEEHLRRSLFFPGLALGVAFGIRPLTSLAVGIPLGLYILLGEKEGRWNRVGFFVTGGLTALLPILYANIRITGSFWQFPYALAGKPMMAGKYLPWGLENVDTLSASFPHLLQGWGWPLFPGSLLLFLPLSLAFLPFLFRRSSREDRLLLGIFIFLCLSLLPAKASGLHGYGPRYLFAACAPLWVLSARAFLLLAREGGRRFGSFAAITAVCLGLWALLILPFRLEAYRGYNDVDGSLRKQLLLLPPDSLLLVPKGNWRVWAEASELLISEDPDKPVIALDLGDNEGLYSCYPDRCIYSWKRGQGIRREE